MKKEIKEIKKRKNDYIDINKALKEDKNSSIFHVESWSNF